MHRREYNYRRECRFQSGLGVRSQPVFVHPLARNWSRDRAGASSCAGCDGRRAVVEARAHRRPSERRAPDFIRLSNLTRCLTKCFTDRLELASPPRAQLVCFIGL
ncbi:hypothetical protein EVAR_48595_1 [Eumeta japonica]|uniref:Uncharacterized protein n=1 Tax=Eumeta variegata TaxID=151549 RepID=A0A4C1Z046_EUMVA|nr:hypothetical protein EVAR_48595_1 [Eumeta japonica]